MSQLRSHPFAFWWNELDRFGSEVGRWVNRFDGNGHSPRLAAGFPALNVWEDDESLYIEAELPGMQLDDLELYVTNGNEFSLKGQRKPQHDDKGVWHRQECGHGTFERQLTLPKVVDAERVTARFEHGVLYVTLPKSAAAKPRRIQVNAS